MTWSVPALVEDAVRAAAARVLPARLLGGPPLLDAVVDRSRRYTSERAALASPTDAQADLAARALFFTIADAAKIRLPLRELRRADRLGVDPHAPLRLVDVGAGCGAMSLGALVELGRRGVGGGVDLTLIDQDERALAIAADALAVVARALDVTLRLTVRAGDVRREPLPPCDLVLAGTVLNELDPAAALALTRRAVASAAIAAILVEPALRTTARALHQLRDAALAAQLAAVLAPCTHAQPCPMLATERDWCHEARPHALPPGAAALARATGLRDGAMKFAYLVLGPPTVVPAVSTLRAVSEPMPHKGRHELWVCDAAGHRKLRVLDRHRTAGAATFRAAVRGDVLTIAPAPDPRGDVAGDAAVARATFSGDDDDA
jgi:hypothetical protein